MQIMKHIKNEVLLYLRQRIFRKMFLTDVFRLTRLLHNCISPIATSTRVAKNKPAYLNSKSNI